MNSDIIPLGPSEVVTDTTINKNVMIIEAITELVISAVVFMHPAQPANPAAIIAFTLPTGAHLFRVKSISFTGTAYVIYMGN